MSDLVPVRPDLEGLMEEFASQAEIWLRERPFVVEFHRFVQEFFKPEHLKQAEWPQFQELGNHIHSLNSVALAKGNAFGRPNFPIEKYRESFHFLAHGTGSIEDRMRAFMGDKETYASKYLGRSVVSELIGELFADQFIFMNRRDVEAAEFLGIQPTYPPGADFPSRFMAFNTALAPLFQAYERIVGNKSGTPVGLAVDQFLSWIYETKIPKKVGQGSKPPMDGRQIWVFAPGPQARYWDECVRDEVAVMGWDELGPLNVYQSKEQIQQRLKELWPSEGEQTNNALSNWEFSHVIKDGDLILVKRGNRKILGAGIVIGDYRFDETRAEYRHVRDVDWTHQGEWLLPDDESFATKTLTNITRYKDFVAKLITEIGIDPPPGGGDAGLHYFWMNCAPDVWRVSTSQVGEEETYTTHNENGNKRQVYACFKAVKPGDLVIGYETTPIQKATSILEITQGLHEAGTEGECISFKVLRHFQQPRSLQELKLEAALADCGPVLGKRQEGSLFQLTKAEYEAVLGESQPVEPPLEIDNTFSVKDALDGLFTDEATLLGWLKQWEAAKNLILQGPPGVGKTFVARRLAYALMEARDPNRVAMVQFHQSYGYEDFVQGYRPGPHGFELRNGVFYDFCLKAKESPKDQRFVFIIDEINRGNLSRILGELLMLIEPDKRGEANTLRLANQGEGQTFFVPENVFILGMMNTADRSLAVVDYALRRRFRFATLQPAFTTTAFQEYLSDPCGDDLSELIIHRVGRLNEAIAKDVTNLGPGFCIGHSYFCRIRSIEDYQDVIRFQIAPLLREYWFDAPKKAEDWIRDLIGQ